MVCLISSQKQWCSCWITGGDSCWVMIWRCWHCINSAPEVHLQTAIEIMTRLHLENFWKIARIKNLKSGTYRWNQAHTAAEQNLGLKKNSHINWKCSNVENEHTIILIYHTKRSVGKFLRYWIFFILTYHTLLLIH